jgi:glycosyltransferase involved in cell wall biosynthesis
MTRIDLCINTQTPPVSPRPGVRPEEGATWRLGVDYDPELGGVVPMMRGLIGHGLGRWLRRPARWIALGTSNLPEQLLTNEGYRLETVQLPDEMRRSYSRFKEEIWRSFHGPRSFEPSTADFPAFVSYSYRSALKLLERLPDHDLFYINDFQQILVGGLIGPSAPALLRWHIPLDFRGYPEPVSRFFLKAMEGFDAMVVSTRAGLEELIHVGYHGRAFQVYPNFDPADHVRATPTEARQFAEKYRLGDGPTVLAVGRMDPVKRQDLLLDAIALVRRRHPTVKCLLVGGESFSTKAGGLKQSKARDWLRHLQAKVRSLRLTPNVVFTGTVSSRELAAAYGAADVFVHPAPWEGFGLVVVEAWTHGCPVIVSRDAGVAELVSEGVNGYTVRPGSATALAERIVQLLDHPDRAERMGAIGAETARRCHVDRAGPRLREIFERTIDLYEKSGLRSGRRVRGWRP